MKYDYCPSCGDLRCSLKCRSKEYLLENTLHGVPYFVDSSRPTWERVIWFILTMTSLGATIGIIVTIWGKFQNEPTFTGLDTDVEDIEIEFPQVQLCVDWPFLNYSRSKSEELHQHVLSASYKHNPNQVDQAYEYSYQESILQLVKELAPDCGTLYTNCSFLEVSKPCEELLSKTFTAAGACCRLPSRSLTKVQVPAKFEFLPTVFPIKVFILRRRDTGPIPGEEPVTTFHTPTDILISLDITYTTENVRSLSKSQRQCIYDDEGYTYNDCELQCLADKLRKRCKCLPWYFRPSKDKECYFDSYQCINQHAIDVRNCKCLLQCDFTAYNIKKTRQKLLDTGETSSISVSVWPKVMFKREVKFGPLDLLTSFGGIAGLFLGYSLLTTVELAYYFTLRAYCGAVLNSSWKRHNIVTVRAAPPPKAEKIRLAEKDHRNNVIFEYVD